MAENPFAAPEMEDKNPFDAPEMIEQSPDTLTDVGKSIRAGAIRAPLHVIGLPGDVEAGVDALTQYARRKIFGEQYAGELPTKHLPTTMDIAHKLGGPAEYTGQTLPGRIAGGAIETALDPLSFAMGPGSLAARVGVGALTGATSAVGEEVAGPAGALIGGTGAGLVAGSKIERAAAQAVRPPAPTPADLRSAWGNRITAGNLAKMRGDEQAAELAEKLDAAVAGSKSASQLRAKLQGIAGDTSLTKEQRDGLSEVINSGSWLELLSSGHGYHLPLSAYALYELANGNFKRTGAALAAVATRLGLRKIDRSRTVRATEQARENVLRGAPSGGGKLPPLPSRLDPAQIPAATVRGLLTPEQETPP